MRTPPLIRTLEAVPDNKGTYYNYTNSTIIIKGASYNYTKHTPFLYTAAEYKPVLV